MQNPDNIKQNGESGRIESAGKGRTLRAITRRSEQRRQRIKFLETDEGGRHQRWHK